MNTRFDEYFGIGMEAPEVVVGLLKIHQEIEYVKIQEYTPHVLGITETLKQKQNISVNQMIRHHPDAGEYLVLLKRDAVTSDSLRDLIDKATKRNKALVLCSKVETRDDEALHIPLLDFECAVSAGNLAKIREFITELGDEGLILESGRSYHYYSFRLVSYKKWLKFMARSLLFTGFIDCRHIGHRILSGEARLRLAKIEGSDRYLVTPRVVSIVEH